MKFIHYLLHCSMQYYEAKTGWDHIFDHFRSVEKFLVWDLVLLEFHQNDQLATDAFLVSWWFWLRGLRPADQCSSWENPKQLPTLCLHLVFTEGRVKRVKTWLLITSLSENKLWKGQECQSKYLSTNLISEYVSNVNLLLFEIHENLINEIICEANFRKIIF